MNKNAFIAFSAALLVCGLCVLFFIYLPHLLYKNIPTNSADVIVVLSGDEGARVEKAAELFKAGVASKIIMSGGGNQYGHPGSYYMKNYGAELGIPKKNIFEESKSESTYDNAIFTQAFLKNRTERRILLVTSAYHSRRTWNTYKKVFKKSPQYAFYIDSPDTLDAYKKWWTHHEKAQAILTEFQKTVVYSLLY